MKKSILLALFGLAAISVPAGAVPTFDFTNCGEGGSNPACSSNVSSYALTTTVGTTSVTATATAFYATGTPDSHGVYTLSALSTAEVGAYNNAGLGICENQTTADCGSPNHQIDNGRNVSLTSEGTSGPEDFEFMLIKFSSAVSLSSLQLGNFGTTGSGASPFDITYYTSSSALNLTLNTQTFAQLASADGFGAAQTSTCTSGVCSEGSGNVGIDTLGTTNTNVTYLLVGASTSANEAGTDFFKIQALNVSAATQVVGTPEPATFGLIGLALAGLGLARRKRNSI